MSTRDSAFALVCCLLTASLPGCSSSEDGPVANGGAGATVGSGGTSTVDGSTWAGSGGAGAGEAGLPPLPCDDGFVFSHDPAVVGEGFTASFSHAEPLVYVDMEVTGAGSPTSSWVGGVGDGPYTWIWNISGHGSGQLSFTFVKDKNGGSGTPVATCQLHSVGSGSGGSGGSGGAGPPPVNRYGMGYVSEGNAADHDLTAKLAGPGAYVTVIFADIKPGRTDAEASWKQSISDAYARDLIPVIRMAPPWGDRRVRNMGESPTSYKALGQVYKDVIASLPKREQWPLYVQVHNEPNLCYEWACDSGALSDSQIAGEYAALLRDAADALHSLNDPRIRVLNGALAPGGVTQCDCATQNGPPGTLATTFLQQMNAAVPGVFEKIDAFASHSYPSKGDGWGFFCPYGEAQPGLLFFEKELAAINKPSLPVLMTETGWTIQHEGYNWSRDQVADFTVDALKNVWLTHPNILGITPFILRDGAWDNFAWTDTNGNPYPVYTKVRAHRCASPGAQNCN